LKSAEIIRTGDDGRRARRVVSRQQTHERVSCSRRIQSMKKTVLTFGLLSGAVSSAMMLATVPFADRIGFDRGAILGYTAIVLSFLLVFFGVRSYRESNGGSITFGRGLTVGLLITLISCLCYVATWQLVYFKLMPGFVDKYAAHTIERMKASGASAEAIQATSRQMADFKVMYDKPLFNAAITFIEPFPIGLAVALISAAALRKKAPAGMPQP